MRGEEGGGESEGEGGEGEGRGMGSGLTQGMRMSACIFDLQAIDI